MDSTEEAHMNNEPTHYLSQSQTNQSLLKIKKTSPNSALIRRKKLTQKHSLSNNKALLNKENHLINLSKIKNQNFEKSKKGFVKTNVISNKLNDNNKLIDETEEQLNNIQQNDLKSTIPLGEKLSGLLIESNDQLDKLDDKNLVLQRENDNLLKALDSEYLTLNNQNADRIKNQSNKIIKPNYKMKKKKIIHKNKLIDNDQKNSLKIITNNVDIKAIKIKDQVIDESISPLIGLDNQSKLLKNGQKDSLKIVKNNLGVGLKTRNQLKDKVIEESNSPLIEGDNQNKLLENGQKDSLKIVSDKIGLTTRNKLNDQVIDDSISPLIEGDNNLIQDQIILKENHNKLSILNYKNKKKASSSINKLKSINHPKTNKNKLDSNYPNLQNSDLSHILINQVNNVDTINENSNSKKTDISKIYDDNRREIFDLKKKIITLKKINENLLSKIKISPIKAKVKNRNLGKPKVLSIN